MPQLIVQCSRSQLMVIHSQVFDHIILVNHIFEQTGPTILGDSKAIDRQIMKCVDGVLTWYSVNLI